MSSKNLIWFFAILITFVLLIVFLQLLRGIYFIRYDVDIHTGRIRTIRNLLFCKISKKIENSILTEAIGTFDEDVRPDWKNVSTVVPGAQYYPYPRFHGASSQIHLVEMLWEMFNFSEEAKRHMAQTVLDKWQADGNDWGAKMYLLDVGKVCFQKKELDPNVIISVADLSSITGVSDTN